jgi:hypothetical protein
VCQQGSHTRSIAKIAGLNQRSPLAGDIPSNSTSPADASESSYTWPYTRSVIAGSWPSHFAVADTVVPLSSIRVAAVCLVSCNRITGTPAAVQWCRNALE